VPVGRVGHHAHHPRRFAQHYRAGAAGPGQLEPRANQAVANCTSRAPAPGVLYLTSRSVCGHKNNLVDIVH
jgi:hypothetical protein